MRDIVLTSSRHVPIRPSSWGDALTQHHSTTHEITSNLDHLCAKCARRAHPHSPHEGETIITNTYPTDEQIEIVRLRLELAELVEDAERLEARVDDEDPIASPLAELHDGLEGSLRRLEALDHLADDDFAGSGVIY